MTRTSTILLALTTGVSCFGGIDLTPAITSYTSSGETIQQLIFKHDNGGIEYEPPMGWRFTGDPRQLHLNPRDKQFADAVIEAVPLQKPQPLDEKAVKTLEEQFVASVPPGSQSVAVVQAEQNPMLLDGNQTFAVTVSYQLMGNKFLRSALFVNLPDTQLIFRLTARKDDFEPLQREFRRSISSWHWKEPKRSAQDGPTTASDSR